MGSPNNGPFSYVYGSTQLYTEALELKLDSNEIVSEFNFLNKEEAIKGLNKVRRELRIRFKRFIRKTGSKYNNFFIKEYKNGLVAIGATKPGNVPKSYAVYTQICYKDGTIRAAFKDTVDNKGNRVHRHVKYPIKEEE